MIIIGLTGGIGSGKTTVAQIFEAMNIPVYYTDPEAKRIMAESSAVKAKLTGRFGNEVYKEGQLDRACLAKLIFDNKDNLEYVNSVVHPEVAKDFEHWVGQHADSPYVLIESAILFESRFDRLVDKTLTVTAPLETRIERIMLRDNVDSDSVLKRIANQQPEEEKVRRSDAVIVNDGVHPLIPQVEAFLSSLNIG